MLRMQLSACWLPLCIPVPNLQFLFCKTQGGAINAVGADLRIEDTKFGNNTNSGKVSAQVHKGRESPRLTATCALFREARSMRTEPAQCSCVAARLRSLSRFSTTTLVGTIRPALHSLAAKTLRAKRACSCRGAKLPRFRQRTSCAR